MSVRSTLLAGASVLVMLAASVTTAASAAAATDAAAAPSCADGIVCAFAEPNYMGGREPITPRKGCQPIAMGAISWRQSAINKSSVTVLFSEHIDYENGTAKCVGRGALVQPGQQVPNFGFRAGAMLTPW